MKLLVLDIDGTLVDVTLKCDNKECNHTILSDGKYYYYMHKRPYLDQFFTFCKFHQFKIVFFSSFPMEYTMLVLNELCKDFSYYFVLSGASMSFTPFGYIKELCVVRQNTKGYIDEIWAIDDSKENFKTTPNHVIHVPTYNYKQPDNILLDICDDIVLKQLEFIQ